MISGNELRNSFNLIMRRLYSIKDKGGGVGGRTGPLKINSSSYIDIYIETCYDVLSNYDKEDRISENKIISFLEEFERISIHFLDNPIQETTRTKAKSIINEYLNEIRLNYKSSTVYKAIDEISKKVQNFEKTSIFDNSSLDTEKGSEKIVKKTQGKKVSKKVKKKNKLSKIFNWRIIIILLFLIGCYFVYANYNLFNSEEVYNINEIEVDDVLEKPQAPIVEEFRLSQLEQEVIDLINEKRIKYGHEEYKVNTVLSELGEDYLQVQLDEDPQEAKNKIGDLTKRRQEAKADENIKESIMNFDRDNIKDTQSLVDRISISDLYSKEMKGIGLAIIEQDNNFHILIDIY